ncbi:histidine phosphatase family protein [Nocardia cyriacigeorgica]|uniref:histidine phosphatase family protein n=1 Tax=Nocardia cyriacigeorgica TaxID=135487 RepID=UPI002016EC1E|nr:histidine phosphatase family protein [Nocardia cyriacigeorgica]
MRETIAYPLPRPTEIAGVWAIRHGQSTVNAASGGPFAETRPRVPDWTIELSPLGRQQAATLGEWWARLSVDRPRLVLCSPYLRTRQTWAAMEQAARGSGDDPVVVVDERLRDREMGALELWSPEAIRRDAPEEAERRARLGDWFYRPPGGESLADVTLRVRDLINDLERPAAQAQILIVAHDASIAALRRIFAGPGTELPEELPPVPNASVSQWIQDGGRLKLVRWGEAPTGVLDE